MEEMTNPEAVPQDSAEMRELKHSVRTHLLLMAGPSQQLCAFLVKTIDLIEDTDSDRQKREILALAFNIIEAIAIYVQKSVDMRAKKRKMPEHVLHRSDNILVMVGRSRNSPDKIAAKHAVLRAVAETLDALGAATNTTYPTLFDSSGKPLNNLEAAAGSVAQPIDHED